MIYSKSLFLEPVGELLTSEVIGFDLSLTDSTLQTGSSGENPVMMSQRALASPPPLVVDRLEGKIYH